MTIQRASDIVLGIYYRLVERGFKPSQAMYLTRCIANSPLSQEFLRENKDNGLDIIAEDLKKAYDSLKKRHNIPTAFQDLPEHERESADPEEFLDDDVLCFLEIALSFHYESDQIIGY